MNKVANDSVYRKRIIDSLIETYLSVSGAICIEGPKWCGKTYRNGNARKVYWEVAKGGIQKTSIIEKRLVQAR